VCEGVRGRVCEGVCVCFFEGGGGWGGGSILQDIANASYEYITSLISVNKNFN
jgi:hypothetical protein